VRGAFDVSLEGEFELDALRTAEEIQRCGAEASGWLQVLASSEKRPEVDIALVREIHYRWFRTTFPADAGRERTQMVLNRKGTAVPVEAILPGIANACENWKWRRENCPPEDPAEEVRFIVAEANCLTVSLYDVHPFLDGNTRTTWHVRNYALMLDGLEPLSDLSDDQTYNDVWWPATPFDHQALDDLVIERLAAQDRSRS
jgi:hypothetical protein